MTPIVRELQRLVDCFTRQPRDFQWQVHLQFGKMFEKEWMRLGYLTWTITCGSSEREQPNTLIVNTPKAYGTIAGMHPISSNPS